MIAERVYVCETCGGEFVPTRRDAKFCGSACKQRSYRRRQHVVDFAETVWKLRAEGEIDGAEALLLLVDPPAKVRERLEVAA
jgi:hypothetical protein